MLVLSLPIPIVAVVFKIVVNIVVKVVEIASPSASVLSFFDIFLKVLVLSLPIPIIAGNFETFHKVTVCK